MPPNTNNQAEIDKAKAKAAEEEAKAKAAEEERIKKQQEELEAEAEKNAEIAMRAEKSPEEAEMDERHERSHAAAKKLKTMAMDFLRTTPDEHVVFGRAGIQFTLGDLRDLTLIR